MQSHVYQNPESYSKNNSLQFQFAMQVLNKTKFDRNLRMLDLGCGDGAITYLLANLADKGSVIGTDISTEMVQFANQKYTDTKNLRFMQMDTAKSVFMKQFDMVTSFNSLHWVKDQQAALKGIAAALVDNGKAILLFSHKKSDYHHVLEKLSASEKWSKYFQNFVNPRSFYTVKEYEELLRNSGLKVDLITEREMTHRFDSVAKFKLFLKSSMANIKSIPLDQQDEFLTDYCQTYLTQTKCNDVENIPVGFWCLDVQARRPYKVNSMFEEYKAAAELRSAL